MHVFFLTAACQLCCLLSLSISTAERNYHNQSVDFLEWQPVLEVNVSCQRFIFIQTEFQGLADQLERFLLGLSLAYKHKEYGITLVVDDDFGQRSLHLKNGYHDIFHDVFGLPRNIMTISQARQQYHPKEIDIGFHKEYLQHLKALTPDDYIAVFGCGIMHKIDAYDSCG